MVIISQFGNEMLSSMFASDWYIGITILVEFFLFFIVLFFYIKLKKLSAVSTNKNKFVQTIVDIMSVMYSLFVTIITIFPLLGMLGTVIALLNINLGDETTLIGDNFFSALTSTAWGIIASIFYKLVNSIAFYNIDEVIDQSSKLVKKEIQCQRK